MSTCGTQVKYSHLRFKIFSWICFSLLEIKFNGGYTVRFPILLSLNHIIYLARLFVKINNQHTISVSLLFGQLEARSQVRGEAQGGEGEPTEDPEWALKQEREEHRRLLAESHSTSLDLRWKLQNGETRWSHERAELLDRFDRERQEWDDSMRELHRKMERVRKGSKDKRLRYKFERNEVKIDLTTTSV